MTFERPGQAARQLQVLGDRRQGERTSAHDSIEYVTRQLAVFREERDWERFHTPKNLALSIMIEVGELLEHFQWISEEEIRGYVSQHESDVAEEIADVVIYAMQLADVLDISLPAALQAKLSLNSERYPVHAARGSHAKHDRLRTSG